MSVVTRIRVSHEVTVPATPDEVWNVLSDVAAYPKWWPALRGVSVLRHQEGLLGSEFEVRPFLGRTFRIRFEELEGRESVRLRFFDGALEGPGGFHLREAGGGTQVRYEMDVFTRGMRIAALSQILPYEWIHRSRMRSVLRRLKRRLKAVRRATAAGVAADPPSQASGSNFEIARRYLDVLSSRADADAMTPFLSPGVGQEEFPHRFLAAVTTRNLDAILQARTETLNRYSSERYELTAATGGGSQVALEVRWKGTVAASGEGYGVGQELDARLAMFLKFADGRIVRQRIYSCFEPWSSASERRIVLDERVAQAGQSGLPPAIAAPATTPPPASNFDIARAYLESLGSRAGAEAVAAYFTPDAVQEEFPNRFLPGGAHRNLDAIRRARSRDLTLLSSENYELLGATGGGSMVALEVAWTGVAGQDTGEVRAGQRLDARAAIILKFQGGRIAMQRTYSCALPPPDGEDRGTV